ncbi:MAG: PAS domain S-box protein [Magnetococcales bacterium]|nr:PAS domain S-box protein [Magnetococcales bacterium]
MKPVSLATQFSRWMIGFAVVCFVAIALIMDHFQDQDRQTLLQEQAQQILDLVFRYRSAQEIDGYNPDGTSPWCRVHRYSNITSKAHFLIKNVSTHPLNPLNYPSTAEQKIVTDLDNGETPRSSGTAIHLEGGPWYVQARPIRYSPTCLSCHNNSGTVTRKVGKNTGSGHGAPITTATLVYIDPLYFSNSTYLFSKPALMITAAFLTLACTFLWIVLVKRTLHPLALVGQAMERFVSAPEEQNLLPLPLPVEVDRLNRSFLQLGQDLLRSQSSLNAGLKELEEEENRFRSLTHAAVDAIISVDENGNVSSWNRGAERIFGYSEQEMMGKSITRLIPEKQIHNHLSAFAAAVATGNTRHRGETMEVSGLHKDGRLVAIEIVLSTWSLSGRRHFSAIIRDIGKRKRNAEKNHRDFMSRMAINSILEVALKPLPLHEQLTRSLQIILAVPWLALQYKGAIFLVNPKTGKLDLTVEQGLGEDIKLRCREIPMGSCLCGQAAETKQIVFSGTLDNRHSIRLPDMSPHGHYCVPVLMDDRLLGVVNLYLLEGHVREVEEIRFLETVAQTLAGMIDHKLNERKLLYLYQAMEQSPVSVLITDLNGTMEYVNPTCCRVTGYEADELLGKNPNIIQSGQMPDAIYRSLWSTILAGNVWHGELHNRRKNGELFWEDVSISPIRDDNGQTQYFLAVKEDVTQRKQLENALADLLSSLDVRVMERTQELNAKVAELEQTRSELVKSEKMASLGRLVAGFAHEINTPIGVAVTGFSLIGETLNIMEDLLAHEEVQEEEFRQVIATIREAADLSLANITRAGELVASFKRTSVDQSSDIRRLFNVREVVMDVIRSLHSKLKKTEITLDVIIDPALNMTGWPGLLEQILTNFIINSLLHGYPSEQPVGRITIMACIEKGEMLLDYADDGVGMEESVRGFAFEPFFTTKRSQGGSGLGLYLCYNIVTSKLNGTITCSSSPGQGVQFHIVFPVSE